MSDEMSVLFFRPTRCTAWDLQRTSIKFWRLKRPTTSLSRRPFATSCSSTKAAAPKTCWTSLTDMYDSSTVNLAYSIFTLRTKQSNYFFSSTWLCNIQVVYDKGDMYSFSKHARFCHEIKLNYSPYTNYFTRVFWNRSFHVYRVNSVISFQYWQPLQTSPRQAPPFNTRERIGWREIISAFHNLKI